MAWNFTLESRSYAHKRPFGSFKPTNTIAHMPTHNGNKMEAFISALTLAMITSASRVFRISHESYSRNVSPAWLGWNRRGVTRGAWLLHSPMLPTTKVHSAFYTPIEIRAFTGKCHRALCLIRSRLVFYAFLSVFWIYPRVVAEVLGVLQFRGN